MGSPVLILFSFLTLTSADLGRVSPDPLTAIHGDSRCLCKCPDVRTVLDNVEFDASDWRSIYVNPSISPKECDCQHVVLDVVQLNASQAEAFCPRCKCQFQIRNLGIMKVVVILVIWVISILVIYMTFLTCLDPLINQKMAGIRYMEQRNSSINNGDPTDTDLDEEGLEAAPEMGPNGTPMRAFAGSSAATSVMNRVGRQQSQWKRQVQEQRRNVFDRHTMLN